MEVVHISNQIVRKALCLSLNEMAILCDIIQMSQSEKYNFTCIKSKQKMADWFDLTRATVHNCINTLESKGYINRVGSSGLRPSAFIQELNQCQDEIGLWIKTNDITLISKKMDEIRCVKIFDRVNNLDTDVKKVDTDSKNILHQVSKNLTQEYNIEYNKAYNKDKMSDFDKFWSYMPVKIGKARSKKLWSKLSDTDKEQIFKTIEAWVKYKPFETYRHPQADTYLSQRRWEDELPVKQQTADRYAGSRRVN